MPKGAITGMKPSLSLSFIVFLFILFGLPTKPISMYFSIESRAPYLSKNLFDFRNKINKNLLIKNGIAKYVLRSAFKNQLPKKIINQREKIGFYSTLNETINLKNKEVLNLILNNPITKKYLNRNLIQKRIMKSSIQLDCMEKAPKNMTMLELE